MGDKVDLSSIFEKLHMENKKVNMEEAEKYLKLNNSQFRSLNFESTSTNFKSDSVGNKIYYEDHRTLIKEVSAAAAIELKSTLSHTLLNLANELETKSELFCQLECLIRNIPTEDTKYSVQLVIQNLTYVSKNISNVPCNYSTSTIKVFDTSPLLILGYVADVLLKYDCAIIYSTKDTASICYLFAELCNKVGIPIKLLFVEDHGGNSAVSEMHEFMYRDLKPEILGVVTERSDLDSALDTLMNAGCYPFPLTHILVQESIYEEFKNIFLWKSSLQQNISHTVDDDLKAKCTNLFIYNGKSFLLNFAGPVDELKNQKQSVVIVEAYRTVKELLSFVNKSKPLCLSLWSNGISEANEIAMGANSTTIWINDYRVFIGPDDASRSIYRGNVKKVTVDIDESLVKNLNIKRANWLKKSFRVRCDLTLKALKNSVKDIGKIGDIESEILKWEQRSFVTVKDKKMCIGVNIPPQTIGITNDFLNKDDVVKFVKAIINGWVVLLYNSSTYSNIYLSEELPCVVQLNNDFKTKKINLEVFDGYYGSCQTKAIYTNFGTTFAN